MYYNEVIKEIARLTEIRRGFGSVQTLYRGENECFPSVSSGLYRYFSGHDAWNAKNDDEKELFLFNYEKKIVQHASIFAGYGDEDYSVENKSCVENFSSKQWELLADVQHRGGITNFIDFTRDVNIALFFACYSEANSPWTQNHLRDNNKDGRIILYHQVSIQPKHVVWNFPQVAYSRIQSGVLVRPRTYGIMDINESCIDIITIPAQKKREILGYLAGLYNIKLLTISDCNVLQW
ncbi:MAG: FRG domain-containing protein [Gemmatimonadetes bacterium]|nr:FRG domain-containing protein [Gemmatimonadota bacterium]